MTQQAGQDERAFLEQLKCASSEADIEDALCLTLLNGLHDARLRGKLSELGTPTLLAFGMLMGYVWPASCCQSNRREESAAKEKQ